MAYTLIWPPDTFSLLNGDMELNRDRSIYMEKMLPGQSILTGRGLNHSASYDE